MPTDKCLLCHPRNILGLKSGFLPELTQDFPDLHYSFEGSHRSQTETLASLKTNGLFALLLIFGLLAVQFKSYFQPLIIMAAIPFGVVGAMIGHLIMGFDLSIISVMGIVALTGVVVNDSLILVDFVNHDRAKGTNLYNALFTAGVRRFRPILLTSLTTFFGLMPMMFEPSLQARFLIPMAISLAFGVMFATLITLLLIPVLYTILEDVLYGLRRLFNPDAIHGSYSVQKEV